MNMMGFENAESNILKLLIWPNDDISISVSTVNILQLKY